MTLTETIIENSSLDSVIIGRSQKISDVLGLIEKAALINDCVIITGESGTGKELVAEEIHQKSTRSNQPFITVNCGAIPEALIESEFFGYTKGAFTGAESSKVGFLAAADQGTLFLDEIGEISQGMQVKLLRALERGGFTPVGGVNTVKPDIRLICATNRRLGEIVQNGMMRADFYFRINVLPIHLPPLRNRDDDIFLLIDHFFKVFGSPLNCRMFSNKELELIREYKWPGNIRELQNALRQYLVMGNLDCLRNTDTFKKLGNEMIGKDVLNKKSIPLPEAINRFEKRYIIEFLEKCRWNKLDTASELGISKKTLRRKMKIYGIV